MDKCEIKKAYLAETMLVVIWALCIRPTGQFVALHHHRGGGRNGLGLLGEAT